MKLLKINYITVFRDNKTISDDKLENSISNLVSKAFEADIYREESELRSLVDVATDNNVDIEINVSTQEEGEITFIVLNTYICNGINVFHSSFLKSAGISKLDMQQMSLPYYGLTLGCMLYPGYLLKGEIVDDIFIVYNGFLPATPEQLTIFGHIVSDTISYKCF